MADLRAAIDYATKNPTSDFANGLQQRITSGQADGEAQQLGIDLTPFKQAVSKPTTTASTDTGTNTETGQPSLLSSAIGGVGDLAKGAFNIAHDFGTGVAKGGMSTINELSKGGAGILNATAGPVIKAVTGKEVNATPLYSSEQAQQQLTPQGTAENIGYTGEKIGEFFAPSGAEEKLFQKGIEHIDKIPGLLNITGKGAEALTGALKVALKSALTGGSTAGVTTVQGGTSNDVQNAGFVGALAGGTGQALETFGKGLANTLQKSGFKLSPAQEAKASAKATNAAKFMTDNKILGGAETKYSKLTKLNSNLESTLQKSLPDNLAVPKQSIIDHINSSIESLKKSDPAIYDSAKADADKAIKLLTSQKSENAFTKGGAVNIKDALNAKRSYGTQAFKTTQFAVKDPRVVSEGSYAVEQGFQKALSDTLDKTNTPIKVPSSMKNLFGGATEVPLNEFNKVYSNAITAKNLTGLSRFKNDTGLVGRMFGLWAGESFGQAIAPGLAGKLIGGAAGEVASTKLPSLARNVGERILGTNEAIPNVAKVGLGVLNQPSPSNQ